MPEQQNKSIVLASRPIGEPIADNFRLETTSVPEVKDGEGLERAPEYFSWLFSGKNFGKLVVKIADE